MKIIIFGTPCSIELIIFYVFITIILPSVLLYILVTSNWFKRIRLALRVPGPSAMPIIGNCHLATDSQGLLDLGDILNEKYGPISRIWISFMPVFVVSDPKDLQNILGSSKNTDKTFFYSLMLNFLGTGLITTSGHKWKKHRKLLQPSFNLNILETFVECFSDSSACLIDKITTMTCSDKPTNITTFINSSVFNVLNGNDKIKIWNQAILGIPVKQCSIENSPFRQGKVVSQHRIDKPWLLFDFVFNLTTSGRNENCHRKNLITFIEQIVERRKKERIIGIYKMDRTSLLERMLDIQDENPEFTDKDIVNEISTFMLAGQESVATTISFCLYFLAKNKHIQNRVLEEQGTIFANSSRMPDMADLQSMVYLEQCIKETLRLYPSVPIMARKLGEAIKIGEHILPVGTDIIISPYATQRIANIYPNPNVYDPDRFTTENCEKRPPFSFIPFSAGPRNCIGYKFAMFEMKTIISTLVRHFELIVNPEYQLTVAFRITLRAKGGIWIQLKPRTISNNVDN